MKKFINKFLLSLILFFLSCENQSTNTENKLFSIDFLEPLQDDEIKSYPIKIVVGVNNPNAIKYVNFFIDDNFWCSTSSADTIQLSYHPPDSISKTEGIEIKALGINDAVQKEITAISYPLGNPGAVGIREGKISEKAGYKIGFTMEREWNRSLKNPLMLARVDCNDLPEIGKKPLFYFNNNNLYRNNGKVSRRSLFAVD